MPTPLTHDDPQSFGPYRPIVRLGSGGMGTVYLARSAGGRIVAVKTMHPGIAPEPGARTRFQLEADAARVIGGQHGARVVNADMQAERPWIATEYVLGPPLDEAVELGGTFPERAVRALGAALCGALGQLHSAEVVHRDLKPSNILVTAYGPKVIDFGIARAIGDDHLTRAGSAMGTPAFMSPEQASGEEHAAAGDVFALAGVLVYAATGRAPFGQGQAADLLYRVRYGEPELSGVPAALVPILAQCLDKNPFRRPTTADLAAQLHDGSGEFADHLPDSLLAEIARRATEVWQFAPRRLPAPPERRAETLTTPTVPMSRRRLLLVGSGLAVGAAAGGTGVWAWSRRSESGQKHPVAIPSNSQLPMKKLDSLWQYQVADPPYGTEPPAQPLAVDNLVTLVAGTGLAGFDARSGDIKWTSTKMEIHWQIATDGERLVRMVAPKGSDGNAGKPGGFPLVLAHVDLLSGVAGEPFAQLSEFNGVIVENQVLGTADGVVYAAAGKGKYDVAYFLASQSWSVFAVDISTGKKLWAASLPSRPDKTDRLHFLAARVVGHHLVALQETNTGKVRIVVRDTRTGAVRWEKPFDGVAPDRAYAPLATDARNLYLGTGRLRALRLSDGAQIWDSRTERPGRTYGPPAVKDGVVYAVEKGLGLVAFDSASGRVQWEEKGGGGTRADVSAAPVIGTDFAYSKRSSALWAIDLASRTPTTSYKTTGNRFIAHEEAKVTIALGGKFLAAFPLR